MDKLLESLQPLACRVISTMDDELDFMSSLYAAKVSANAAFQTVVGDKVNETCRASMAFLTEADARILQRFRTALEEHRNYYGENAGDVENSIGYWDDIRARFSDMIPGRSMTGEE